MGAGSLLLLGACASTAFAADSVERPQSFAYVIATYAGNRHQRSGDPIPPQDILKLHLHHLATVPMALRPTVLVVRPPLLPGHTAAEGFYDVDSEVEALRSRGIPVTWLQPAANEGLGASYLFASEETQGFFDYYFWTKDDYAATAPHFDAELLRMHSLRFGSGVGVISALLMGAGHEPVTTAQEYPQGAMFASSQTVRQLFTTGSESPRDALRRHAETLKFRDPMSHIFGGSAVYSYLQQQVLGSLFRDHLVPLATWSGEFRSPYWSGSTSDEEGLLDFGIPVDHLQVQIPLDHILVAPLQHLDGSLTTIKVCCGPVGIKGCGFDTSCITRLSASRSCCASWNDAHAVFRNASLDELLAESRMENAGLLPSSLLQGSRTFDIFMHWAPPPYELLEHRHVALPIDLSFVSSFRFLREAVTEQMMDLCNQYLPVYSSSPRRMVWRNESCAFDLAEQASRKVRNLLSTALVEFESPLITSGAFMTKSESRLDIALPCVGPSGSSLLFPQSVGIFLRGATDYYPVEVPMHGYRVHNHHFSPGLGQPVAVTFDYVTQSSRELFDLLLPQFLSSCSQTALPPSWTLLDCANDLLDQIDSHLRGLCLPISSSVRRHKRFLGIGENFATPVALRYAWLRSAASPFDFTISSAHSVLALLSGLVHNMTQDVRLVRPSDLNEHWRSHLNDNATFFMGRPYSPALNMLFADDRICEWSPRYMSLKECVSIRDFHEKYEERRLQFLDWVNDGSADLDLIYSHVSNSPLRRSPSKLDALLDISKIRTLLSSHPHVRVSTIEASLPIIQEQCEANFEVQRKLSQRVSRALMNAGNPSHRFHAITFDSNTKALAELCGWMDVRRPLAPDAFWLEDWYDRIVNTSISTSLAAYYHREEASTSEGGGDEARSVPPSSAGPVHAVTLEPARTDPFLKAILSKPAAPSFEGKVNTLPNNWLELLPIDQYRTRPIRYLEIGTFFGANLLSVAVSYGAHPESILHCIDPWEDYEEYPEYKGLQSSTYESFLRNVDASGHGHRVVVNRGYSSDRVPTFDNDFFDIIYVDGNHEPEYALEDAVLSFRKLKVGGVIIFDDYGWGGADLTKRGVDAFLFGYRDRLTLLGSAGTQVFARKTR